MNLSFHQNLFGMRKAGWKVIGVSMGGVRRESGADLKAGDVALRAVGDKDLVGLDHAGVERFLDSLL